MIDDPTLDAILFAVSLASVLALLVGVVFWDIARERRIKR